MINFRHTSTPCLRNDFLIFFLILFITLTLNIITAPTAFAGDCEIGDIGETDPKYHYYCNPDCANGRQSCDVWCGSAGGATSHCSTDSTSTTCSANCDGGSGGSSCFIPGTQVSTPQGQKKIETLKPGDSVFSFNELTGKSVLNTVVSSLSRTVSQYYIIKTQSGREVKTTAEHPFFTGKMVGSSILSSEYTKVKDLKVGDKLFVQADPLLGDFVGLAGSGLVVDRIVSIDKVSQSQQVYNLHVAEPPHNFFAGGFGVHNKDDGLRVVGRIYKDGIVQDYGVYNIDSSDGKVMSQLDDTGYQIGRWVAGTNVTISLTNPGSGGICEWTHINRSGSLLGSDSGSCSANITIAGGDVDWENHLNWSVISIPAPSQPTVSAPACSSVSYNATISWSGTPNPSFGFYVDLTEVADWSSMWNKNVNPGTSTTAPDGFSVFRGSLPTLTLNPETTYYTVIYNGTHSPVTSFVVPACQCTGTNPANARMCDNDDKDLTANTPKSLVASCTSGTKCEFICDSELGYVYYNGNCIKTDMQCNQGCVDNIQCASDYCYNSFCRNPACPSSTDGAGSQELCTCPTAPVAPVETPPVIDSTPCEIPFGYSDYNASNDCPYIKINSQGLFFSLKDKCP